MRIKDLTSASAVEEALREYDSLGGHAFRTKYGSDSSTQYYLSHADLLYDAEAIAGVAHGYQHQAADPLPNAQLNDGAEAATSTLRAMGFTVLNSHTKTVKEEREWRLAVWQNLLARRDDSGLVTSDAIRSVGAYGNYRGIWADMSRTRQFHPDGVTIGLKHTGQHYPDDLSESGALYHYPSTLLPGRDLAEVNATKAAATLQLPYSSSPSAGPSVACTSRGWRVGRTRAACSWSASVRPHPFNSWTATARKNNHSDSKAIGAASAAGPWSTDRTRHGSRSKCSGGTGRTARSRGSSSLR
ncbi:hypothetical protein ACFQ2M_12590 [Kitasatospora saccharophila]|uniref:hypothetical protein n=1 Tax=Kitasatospora saccharophila TaxID=407973 RepID=UPI003645BB1F